MNARVTNYTTGDIVVYSQQSLIAEDSDMARSGAAANQVAVQYVFDEYISKKASNTLQSQRTDLQAFCTYLVKAGVVRTAEYLQSDREAWRGITWGQVEGFKKWMLNQGYAISTINHALSTIKTYVKLAKQAEAIDSETYLRIKDVDGFSSTDGRNADEKRATTRRSNKKAQPVAITPEQAALLKDQPNTPQGRRDKLIMCLLLDHGLRAGELARLTVDCFDMASGMMRFSRPKVDKVQNHKLSADTLRVLHNYIGNGDCPTEGLLLRGSRKGGKLDGQGMNEIAITVRVGQLGTRIGVKGLSAHDCRHYWATYWAKKVDILRLQEAGGWSSLEMPRRYIARAEVANEGMA